MVVSSAALLSDPGHLVRIQTACVRICHMQEAWHITRALCRSRHDGCHLPHAGRCEFNMQELCWRAYTWHISLEGRGRALG